MRTINLRRIAISGVLALAALVPTGCGGSMSAVTPPRVAPARVFSLGGFRPLGEVAPGRPTTISFTVLLPSGRPLTSYRTGSGPHTGVHLIVVRDDLAYIIHQHPPIASDGLVRQSVTFPAPGPYRILVDLYPNLPGSQPNFQLARTVTVEGRYRPRPLPAFTPAVSVDGFHVEARGRPTLHAIQAKFVNFVVTDAAGRKVGFVPWFGALAHAIFFRQGSLDYFHSHVCAPSAPNCGSLTGVGSSRVAGRSTAPGRLTVGVLLPTPGTWRLFLQMKVGDRVITAPFTLEVGA